MCRWVTCQRACHLHYRGWKKSLSTLGAARFASRYGALLHLHRRLKLKALLDATKRRRVIFIRTAVLFTTLVLRFDIDLHVLNLPVVHLSLRKLLACSVLRLLCGWSCVTAILLEQVLHNLCVEKVRLASATPTIHCIVRKVATLRPAIAACLSAAIARSILLDLEIRGLLGWNGGSNLHALVPLLQVLHKPHLQGLVRRDDVASWDDFSRRAPIRLLRIPRNCSLERIWVLYITGLNRKSTGWHHFIAIVHIIRSARHSTLLLWHIFRVMGALSNWLT